MRTLLKLALAGAAVAALLCGRAQAAAPAFERYPVSGHYTKPAAAPRLAQPRDREYRSALKEAARQPVNFAGQYVLTTIGCGASCIMLAALDAKTGRVSWLPFTLCCWAPSVDEPVLFKADSDLVILHGQRNEAGKTGPHYFRLVGGRFVKVGAARR